MVHSSDILNIRPIAPDNKNISICNFDKVGVDASRGFARCLPVRRELLKGERGRHQRALVVHPRPPTDTRQVTFLLTSTLTPISLNLILSPHHRCCFQTILFHRKFYGNKVKEFVQGPGDTIYMPVRFQLFSYAL